MSRAGFVPTLAPLVAAALALAGAAAADPLDLHVRGLLDLAATHDDAFVARYDQFAVGETSFDPYRVRLFLDAQVTPTLALHAQGRFGEDFAVNTSVVGAYAVWTPWSGRDAHLMAGKIPWIVGTWADRAYSNRNPLIGAPLMYQFPTTLAWDQMPFSTAGLLAARGSGATGVNYGGGPGMPGMPVVWEDDWDFGAAVTGSARPLEYAIGAGNGSPGWPQPGYDHTPGRSVLGRLGLVPTPALRVGVSGAWGTYLEDWNAAALPAGETLSGYHESLVMGDASYEQGHVELRSEGFWKAWDTAYVGRLQVRGGYGELRVGLPAGTYVAARGEALRFGRVADGAGGTQPWDDDVDRWEAGLGWRVTHGLILKLDGQRNVVHAPGAPAANHDLLALGASVAF